MNLIDAFFVEVGIDKSKFDLGQKQALEELESTKKAMVEGASVIETSIGKAVNESFRTVERHFLAFFAAMLGARSVRDFVQNVTQAEVQLGIMAAALGTSIPNLSAFEMAVERIGGKGEEAAASLANFNRMVIGFNLEGQPAPLAFYRLGGSNVDPRADRLTQFQQFAEQVQKAKFSEAQKRQFMNELGIDAFTQSLLLDPGMMRALMAQTLGDAVTPGQASAGQHLQGSFRAAAQAVQSLGREALAAVQGPLGDLLERLRAWVEDNKAWIAGWFGQKAQDFKAWVDGLDWAKIGKTMTDALASVRGIVEQVGGWKTVIVGTVGAILALKAAPILTLAGGLAAMMGPLGTVLVGLTSVLAAYKLLSGTTAHAEEAKPGPVRLPGAVPPSRTGQTIKRAEEGTDWRGVPVPQEPAGGRSGSDGGSQSQPPKKAVAGRPEQSSQGVQIETSEGAIGEWRPLPVKIIDGNKGFLEYMAEAFGVLGEMVQHEMGSFAIGRHGAHGALAARGAPESRAVTRWWTPERIKHAYDYFMSTGMFSQWGAAAAVARMTFEAPGGPGSVNSIGAFGIAQWLGPRRSAFLSWARAQGMDIYDPDAQLKFYAHELQTTEGAAAEKFRNAQSADEGSWAASAFERAEAPYIERTPTRRVYDITHPAVAPAVHPAADKAATGAKTSVLMTHRNYNVARVEVYARSAETHSLARDVRTAMERELTLVRVT